jgi:hypothetical protein
MKKVQEYEQHAAACRKRAAETKNVELKKQLEQAAELWERLAAERRQGRKPIHDQCGGKRRAGAQIVALRDGDQDAPRMGICHFLGNRPLLRRDSASISDRSVS